MVARGLRWSHCTGLLRLHKRDIRPIGEAGYRGYAISEVAHEIRNDQAPALCLDGVPSHVPQDPSENPCACGRCGVIARHWCSAVGEIGCLDYWKRSFAGQLGVLRPERGEINCVYVKLHLRCIKRSPIGRFLLLSQYYSLCQHIFLFTPIKTCTSHFTTRTPRPQKRSLTGYCLLTAGAFQSREENFILQKHLSVPSGTSFMRRCSIRRNLISDCTSKQQMAKQVCVYRVHAQ